MEITVNKKELSLENNWNTFFSTVNKELSFREISLSKIANAILNNIELFRCSNICINDRIKLIEVLNTCKRVTIEKKLHHKNNFLILVNKLVDRCLFHTMPTELWIECCDYLETDDKVSLIKSFWDSNRKASYAILNWMYNIRQFPCRTRARYDFIEKYFSIKTALICDLKLNDSEMGMVLDLNGCDFKGSDEEFLRLIERSPNLKKLTIHDKFNLRIPDNCLKNIEDLKIKKSYNYPFPEEMTKLESLCIHGSCGYHLPKKLPSLHTLVILQNYAGTLPEELPKINHLSLYEGYDSPLPQALPLLKILELGNSFTQLLPQKLPSIIHLSLGDGYTHPLPQDLSTLRFLKLGASYSQPLPEKLSSLKEIVLPRNYPHPLPEIPGLEVTEKRAQPVQRPNNGQEQELLARLAQNRLARVGEDNQEDNQVAPIRANPAHVTQLEELVFPENAVNQRLLSALLLACTAWLVYSHYFSDESN